MASVEAQSPSDYEILVIDDASDPPLSSVLEGRPHCRVLTCTGRGAAAARNTGIKEAEGEYLAFLDSDDVFVPGKLARIANALEANSEAVIYSRVLMDYGRGATILKPGRGIRGGESMPDYLFVANELIATPSLVVPRGLARATLWNEALSYGDDSDFIIRLWSNGARFCFLPEVLAYCDMRHGGSHLSDSRDAAQMQAWLSEMRPLLGASAESNYRATHLLALQGWKLSGRTLVDAGRAIALGHATYWDVTRSMARGMLPPSAYRALHRHWLRRRDAGLRNSRTTKLLEEGL